MTTPFIDVTNSQLRNHVIKYLLLMGNSTFTEKPGEGQLDFSEILNENNFFFFTKFATKPLLFAAAEIIKPEQLQFH